MRTSKFGSNVHLDMTDIILEYLPYETDEEKSYIDSITDRTWMQINNKITDEIEKHVRENIDIAVDRILQ